MPHRTPLASTPPARVEPVTVSAAALAKRRKNIDTYKSTELYLLIVAYFGQAEERCHPPGGIDRLSKRQWEHACQQWRANLRELRDMLTDDHILFVDDPA